MKRGGEETDNDGDDEERCVAARNQRRRRSQPKASLEPSDVAAVRASWSVYHHPRTHRREAWAASLASPRGVSRAHLRQRRVSRRGRYIWRRDALEPQPLLSRPSIHNSPSRLVIDSRDAPLCACSVLRKFTRGYRSQKCRQEILKRENRNVSVYKSKGSICSEEQFCNQSSEKLERNWIDSKVN